MSEVKVNKISPRSGTTVTLGDSGDTITVPSGATLDASNATTTLPANVVTTTGTQTLTNKTIGSSQLTGALPALDGSALTGIPDTIAPTRHSIRPSLNLDFANSKELDPRITFTRASNATYYDGYTSVKAEENLSYPSIPDSNWIATRVNLTTNNATAPDGTNTATLITLNSGSSTTYYLQSDNTANTSQTEFTTSIFAKAGTHNFVQLWVNSQSSFYANFDLSTGSVGTTGGGVTTSITDVGNSWYRISMTFTSNGHASASWVAISFQNSSSDGRVASWSATGTETVYLWGGQSEQRDSLTAYTPTTSSPITKYQPALQTAGNNVARFDHNPTTGESLGLLIEESRTNLNTFSAPTSANNGTTFTNSAIAPDGTLTASEIKDNGTSTVFVGATNVAYTAGNTYTFSYYAKLGSYTGSVGILIYGTYFGGSNLSVYFDLSNGTVSGTPSAGLYGITDVGNGWYRIYVTATCDTSGSQSQQMIRLGAGQADKTFYAWGFQLEEGSFPTSYIKTTGSQVTRSADSASMTGTNFSDWYRQDNGSVYVDGNIGSGNFPYAFYIGDGTTNNRHILYRVSGNATSNTYFGALTTANGTTQVSLNGLDAVAKKFVYSYTTDNFSAVANGGTVIVDNYGILPTADRLWIGSYNNSSFFANGTIKKLSYYPIKLTNNEIIDLSEE